MLFRLENKVALVTGGSRGIGQAIVERLADSGAFVAINYRSNQQAALQTLQKVQECGGDGTLLQFDVGDSEACGEAIRDLVSQKGRVDVLVNNAGIAIDQLLARVKPDQVSETWRTNIDSAIWCAKAVIRKMMKNRWGRIINVSSVVGEAGNAGQPVYSASKAALIGLTKTLAREYASRGITVNAVAPGYIATDMTAGLTDTAQEMIVKQTPLGRVGTPQEVANAVLFLASEEASYITGQVLRVNGGMYM
ncbi:MAG: beta-ketoacyl-ACP reductase [Myxococcota bacterium]